MDYNEKRILEQTKIAEKMLAELPPFINDYKNHIENSVTIRTQIAYYTDIRAFLAYTIDRLNLGIDIKEITPEHLKQCDSIFFDGYFDYVRHYVSDDGTERVNREASLKRKLSSIKGLMTWLYEEGKLPDNAITKVRMAKLRHKSVIYMETEEAESFLDSVRYGTGEEGRAAAYHNLQKNRDMAIMTLMLSTGIRVSECVGLSLSDVDMKRCSLRVTGKGEKEGIVYFSDNARDLLEKYMEERKNIAPVQGHEEALFLSSQKKRITVKSVERLVKKYAAVSVRTKRITPHKLRSTFAQNLYEETNDIYLVKDALRHSTLGTVQKYVSDSDARKKNARNKGF